MHQQNFDSKHWSPLLYILDSNWPWQNCSTNGESSLCTEVSLTSNSYLWSLCQLQVDYELNTSTGTVNALHGRDHFTLNLSLLLQWSPYSSETELLKQVRFSTPYPLFFFSLFSHFFGNLGMRITCYVRSLLLALLMSNNQSNRRFSSIFYFSLLYIKPGSLMQFQFFYDDHSSFCCYFLIFTCI